MLPALLALPGKLTTLMTRLTDTRATKLDNLDATISSRSSLTQAQAASGVWASATRTLTSAPSVIKSVQRGTIQITVGTQAWVLITQVVPAKTLIVSSYSGPWDIDENSRIRLSLTLDGLSVRADRTGVNGHSCYVSFEVVEFY